MAAITNQVVSRISPDAGLVMAVIQTQNTADAADTIAITLADLGIAATGLLSIFGAKHTTDGSVIVTEAPTTSVTSGVLTITVPAGTDNDTRVYTIIGKGVPPTYS